MTKQNILFSIEMAVRFALIKVNVKTKSQILDLAVCIIQDIWSTESQKLCHLETVHLSK